MHDAISSPYFIPFVLVFLICLVITLAICKLASYHDKDAAKAFARWEGEHDAEFSRQLKEKYAPTLTPEQVIHLNSIPWR